MSDELNAIYDAKSVLEKDAEKLNSEFTTVKRQWKADLENFQLQAHKMRNLHEEIATLRKQRDTAKISAEKIGGQIISGYKTSSSDAARIKALEAKVKSESEELASCLEMAGDQADEIASMTTQMQELKVDNAGLKQELSFYKEDCGVIAMD